jgi:hypothetical protein
MKGPEYSGHRKKLQGWTRRGQHFQEFNWREYLSLKKLEMRNRK